MPGHGVLLFLAAVVLYGENEGVGGGGEGALLDDPHHLQEGDLGGERVTVEYDRQTVLTVPTVQLYTPTPCTGYLTLYCAVCTIQYNSTHRQRKAEKTRYENVMMCNVQ